MSPSTHRDNPRTAHWASAATLCAGLSILVVATGCASGQIAGTAEIQSAIDGANGNAGAIAVRNARVGYPDGGVALQGGTATLLVTLVNDAVSAQQLVKVSSPAATSTTLSASSASSPSASSLPTASSSGPIAPSASTTSSPSASPSASISPSAAAPAGVNLTVPGQGIRRLTSAGESIQLVGLTRDLVAGRTVPVTFTFSSGASVTLQVPISVPGTYQHEPSASATAGLGEPSTG